MAFPGSYRPPWHAAERAPAIVGGFAGLLAIGAAAIQAAADDKVPWFSVLVFAFAVVAVGASAIVSVRRAGHLDALAAKERSPEYISGCLHVLHAILVAYKRAQTPPAGWLRLTIHRLDGDVLEQSVDYVGSDDGGAGRRFPINAGLIGMVARTEKPRWFHRPPTMSFEDWAMYLVDSHGMTKQAAWNTRKDRLSFFGTPIYKPSGSVVRAVVYVDSSDANFFDDHTMSLIISACKGMAAWIDEIYY